MKQHFPIFTTNRWNILTKKKIKLNYNHLQIHRKSDMCNFFALKSFHVVTIFANYTFSLVKEFEVFLWYHFNFYIGASVTFNMTYCNSYFYYLFQGSNVISVLKPCLHTYTNYHYVFHASQIMLYLKSLWIVFSYFLCRFSFNSNLNCPMAFLSTMESFFKYISVLI